MADLVEPEVATAFTEGERLFRELTERYPLDDKNYNPVLNVLQSYLYKCGIGLDRFAQPEREG